MMHGTINIKKKIIIIIIIIISSTDQGIGELVGFGVSAFYVLLFWQVFCLTIIYMSLCSVTFYSSKSMSISDVNSIQRALCNWMKVCVVTVFVSWIEVPRAIRHIWDNRCQISAMLWMPFQCYDINISSL